MRALAASVLLATLGCGGSLESAPPCAPIPDGTYVGAGGDAFTFSGGGPSGNWSCTPNAGCPGQIGCTPIGETVYVVAFVNEGGGTIEATTSPPDETVVLTAKGGV